MRTFGDYELDTRLYELRAAGQPAKLEPRVFNVLAYLVQHRTHTPEDSTGQHDIAPL